MGLKSNIPPSVAPRPVHHSNTNINCSIVNGTHGGNHQMPNGRQYLTPGPAVHNSSNKGFYNGNVEQYQHQDNRRVMNAAITTNQRKYFFGFEWFPLPVSNTTANHSE
jgi:hypothetical protein